MEITCKIIPLSSYDVILGCDWISTFVLSTNWPKIGWYLCDTNDSPVLFCPKAMCLSNIKSHTLNVLQDVSIEQLSRYRFRKEMKKKHNELFVCLHCKKILLNWQQLTCNITKAPL
ncbi:hypothetical protein PSHT_08316 [Puccinia striiformis]|uniref:Uncharacterized protein n=1 Tax=Puccinia striiformis TaxID=27350 RepID=A0A2S4VQC9_9BASI|nr:hypothetical protein PSHT_08316 [Puccinia striiformis]